jgi:hypothetical protein
MALPHHVGRVRSAGHQQATKGPILALVRPVSDSEFEATVVDGDGHTLIQLDGYRTIGLPAPLDDGVISPLREAMGEKN